MVRTKNGTMKSMFLVSITVNDKGWLLCCMNYSFRKIFRTPVFAIAIPVTSALALIDPQ